MASISDDVDVDACLTSSDIMDGPVLTQSDNEAPESPLESSSVAGNERDTFVATPWRVSLIWMVRTQSSMARLTWSLMTGQLATFYKQTSEHHLRHSCCKQGVLFHNMWMFIERENKSHGQFSQHFVVERFKGDQPGLSITVLEWPGLSSLWPTSRLTPSVGHLDHHMKDERSRFDSE